MRKHVWILNHYAGSMYFDQGGRHYNFAKYLRRAGYAPVVFCCNAKHGKPERFFETDALWEVHPAEEIDVPFVFVKGRTYVGNGKQRVLNMIDFYRNVRKAAVAYAEKYGKPDVILASSVHPLTLVAGLKLAKRFGVPCICEVRDLWPESIVAYSSRLTRSNPLIRLLYAGEHWIYRRADRLIFTIEGGYDYIVDQGWEKDIPRDKVFYLNNGVDLEVFQYNCDHHRIEDPDLDDPDTFKVIYTGSVRQVNHLSLLLDVAKCLEERPVRFLIWGDGEELPALRKRAVDEQISNVRFKGRVPKEFVPSIVTRADLNFAHNAPAPLFRFGISFNKIFDYLAAGKPVLSDFPCPYNPAVLHGAGVAVEDPAPEHIAAAIAEMMDLSREAYERYCRNAAAAAHDYDFQNLTEKLLAVIETTDKERMPHAIH